MSPKEKAKELVDRFINIKTDYCDSVSLSLAIECALICVKEIITNTFHLPLIDKDNTNNVTSDYVEYWQQVKEEIDKL